MERDRLGHRDLAHDARRGRRARRRLVEPERSRSGFDHREGLERSSRRARRGSPRRSSTAVAVLLGVFAAARLAADHLRARRPASRSRRFLLRRRAVLLALPPRARPRGAAAHARALGSWVVYGVAVADRLVLQVLDRGVRASTTCARSRRSSPSGPGRVWLGWFPRRARRGRCSSRSSSSWGLYTRTRLALRDGRSALNAGACARPGSSCCSAPDPDASGRSSCCSLLDALVVVLIAGLPVTGDVEARADGRARRAGSTIVARARDQPARRSSGATCSPGRQAYFAVAVRVSQPPRAAPQEEGRPLGVARSAGPAGRSTRSARRTTSTTCPCRRRRRGPPRLRGGGVPAAVREASSSTGRGSRQAPAPSGSTPPSLHASTSTPASAATRRSVVAVRRGRWSSAGAKRC